MTADFNKLGNQTIEKEALYQCQLNEPYRWQEVDLFYDQHPYFRIGYQNPLNNTSSAAARCLGPYRSSRNFFHESADHFYPKKMDMIEEMITERLTKKIQKAQTTGLVRASSDSTLLRPPPAPSEEPAPSEASSWTWTVASRRNSKAGSVASGASRPSRRIASKR
jgi:hypothetical protein